MNNIKKERLKHGITQKKLAEKSGLSERTIIRLENSENTATIYVDSALKIANALNITVEELFKNLL